MYSDHPKKGYVFDYQKKNNRLEIEWSEYPISGKFVPTAPCASISGLVSQWQKTVGIKCQPGCSRTTIPVLKPWLKI
jgi:hypothetical protein